MPFDPTYPPANADIESAPLRDQFNSLNADIQTRITDPQLALAIVNALQQTSANSNAVGQLGISADPNYSQSQMQDLINKLDELIATLRRL